MPRPLPSYSFGPIPEDQRTDEHLRAVARLPGLAFGYAVDETLPWYRDEVGLDNLRIATLDGPKGPWVAGSLGQIPMGIHINGREVEQLGVLGVAVAPEARGTGIATRMMADTLRAMHDDGVPLSTLYSALHPLYRGCGYETAGVLCDAVIPAAHFSADGAAGGWQVVTEGDIADIKDCYRRYAININGTLARPEYVWKRVRERTGPATGFMHRGEDGAIDAYCFVVQKKWAEPDSTAGTTSGARLTVSDIAWTSGDGLARLARFFRGYSSMVGEVHVSLPPNSQLVTAIPDWRYDLKVRNAWLARIVSVKPALEARGYPTHTNAALTLELTDDIIPANAGTWTLTLSDGRAKAEPGSPPNTDPLRLDITDLAPLYTGYATPHDLRAAGRAECSDETASAAAAIFATSGFPSMTDMF